MITPALLRARSIEEPGAGIPFAGMCEWAVGQLAVLEFAQHALCHRCSKGSLHDAATESDGDAGAYASEVWVGRTNFQLYGPDVHGYATATHEFPAISARFIGSTEGNFFGRTVGYLGTWALST